ncbi:MAG: hypothetical protein LBN36_01115 [Clostridiales Family XIII bacterium]|jgi:hypothetical protein|nr:hypothetical protein [Clostridiales Family XIII bacterium]
MEDLQARNKKDFQKGYLAWKQQYMLRLIRRIDLRIAGFCSVGVSIIGMIVHLLVLLQVIPFSWINGGNTTSFEAQLPISIVSILVLILLALLALIGSKIIPVKLNTFLTVLLVVVLIVKIPYDLVECLLQFMGTPFERSFLGIVLFIGFLADSRIAVEKRFTITFTKKNASDTEQVKAQE